VSQIVQAIVKLDFDAARRWQPITSVTNAKEVLLRRRFKEHDDLIMTLGWEVVFHPLQGAFVDVNATVSSSLYW
jgi:hypothetical protein